MSHLLLIEDDSDLASGLNASLAQSGYDVTHLTNGSEAVAACDGSNYDVVVLDLGLPDIDGIEALKLAGTNPGTLDYGAQRRLELARAAALAPEYLLLDGRYHVLGTDTHRIDGMPARMEGLKRAVALIGESGVNAMMARARSITRHASSSS